MIPRKEPSLIATILGGIIIVILVVIAVAAVPLLALLVGMFIGQIIEWMTGDYLVRALNAIGLSGVKDGDLPKIFGLLSVVAMYFRSSPINRGKKDDDE